MEKPLPKFQGEPLVGTPLFQQLKSDAFGREIVKRVNDEYRGTPAEINLDYLQGKNKPVTNSNAYRLFAIDKVARDIGARVMLPEESEFLIADKDDNKNSRLPEYGNVYYDLGLALDFSRNEHYLAVKLYESIPKELRRLENLPAIMLALKLNKKNSNLLFEYGENSQLRTATILCEQTGKFREDDSNLVEKGFPLQLRGGYRTFYTAIQLKPLLENLGLRRFCLSSRDLDAGSPFLSDAGRYGRVGIIGGETTAPRNLTQYIKKRDAAREKYIKELSKIREDIDKEIRLQ